MWVIFEGSPRIPRARSLWYFAPSTQGPPPRGRALAPKVGFHRVFKALVDKKKPLVGHNLLYDLLFMMAAFHGAPMALGRGGGGTPGAFQTMRAHPRILSAGELPATWGEWKALTHTLFPTIYDTKVPPHPLPRRWLDTPVESAVSRLLSSLNKSTFSPAIFNLRCFQNHGRFHFGLTGFYFAMYRLSHV